MPRFFMIARPRLAMPLPFAFFLRRYAIHGVLTGHLDKMFVFLFSRLAQRSAVPTSVDVTGPSHPQISCLSRCFHATVLLLLRLSSPRPEAYVVVICAGRSVPPAHSPEEKRNVCPATMIDSSRLFVVRRL